jgi:predicted phosphodiesterase
MRVAALNDVHGNLPALEAVLAELDGEGIDAIVSGGDLVLGPFPAECLALLRERDGRFLHGNCERSVLGRIDAQNAWCADRLDDEARDFVAAWPPTISLDGVLYCHATPENDEDILTRATPPEIVAAALSDAEEPLIVAGHTHQQYEQAVGGKRLVNAGSIGLPYEGEPAAFWAIVEDGAVDLRRTDYDVAAAVQLIFGTGFPTAADWLEGSLVKPEPPDAVTAFFERHAGRGA